jgi:type II secretory pathway component PulM
MQKFLAVGFVVLAVILVWLLSNPPRKGRREGVDDTLVRIDQLEQQDKDQNAEIEKLKKQFSDSTSRIADGEKQANAAIGTMQMVV